VAGSNQVNLAWTIPLDQGVSIANSATEATTGIVSGGANGYVRGDVGVQVYRNGAVVSAWGTGTSLNDMGLAPNTLYTYTLEARDNNSGARGIWYNATGPQATNNVWTLSIAPNAGSVAADNLSPTYGDTVNWSGVSGFGAGTVQYYRYAFDTSATHTFTGSEAQWSSGTVATIPTSAGTWYLHVKGYNGANVANGTFDYAVTVGQKTLTVTGIGASNKFYDGTMAAALTGTPGTLSGVINGDSVSLTGTALGAFAGKDVGTNIVVSVSGQTLTGPSATNYTLTEPTAAAAITPKALTETGLSVPASKVYDATTNAMVTGTPALQSAESPGSGTPSDGKPYTGDTVSISGTATGTYNSKDVATASSVTFGGLNLGGAQAFDYTLVIQSPAAATITRKALTMSGLSVPSSKVYDSTTAAVVSGTPVLQTAEGPGTGTTGDGKPYTGDAVSITGTAIGTYNSPDVATANSVTFSGLSLGGGQAGDYSLTIQSPAAATITPGNSATALVSSQNPSMQSSNVTFTATLSAVSPAAGTPTGKVVFVANSSPFSTNALAGGIAAANLASLPVGTNTIAAQYGGDGDFLGSTNTLQQVIQSLSTCSQTNAILGIADNSDGTFTITFVGTSQAQYYVIATSDISPPAAWSPLAGSTNTVTAPSGVWSCTVTNTGSQKFYRSVAITPCP
jgi:hypothetical protein